MVSYDSYKDQARYIWALKFHRGIAQIFSLFTDTTFTKPPLRRSLRLKEKRERESIGMSHISGGRMLFEDTSF